MGVNLELTEVIVENNVKNRYGMRTQVRINEANLGDVCIRMSPDLHAGQHGCKWCNCRGFVGGGTKCDKCGHIYDDHF